ncbi:hypothetical protein IJM86_00170 [bacterium]|nr:hypothetical protein [bacterium]
MQLEKGTDFKLLSSCVRNILPLETALFYTEEGTYLIMTDDGHSAKELAKKYALKGGGTDVCVQ